MNDNIIDKISELKTDLNTKFAAFLCVGLTTLPATLATSAMATFMNVVNSDQAIGMTAVAASVGVITIGSLAQAVISKQQYNEVSELADNKDYEKINELITKDKFSTKAIHTNIKQTKESFSEHAVSPKLTM